MNENLCLSSKVIELSESKSYIELTNRLCYYDRPNLNGVQLPSEDAEEKAKTLINQPVVAKYKRVGGKDDLGGHEAVYNSHTQDIEFDTDCIGTHIKTKVKKDTVTINGQEETLPCLFATARIWKRNKNVVNAVKRLYDEGKLFSSWEIAVDSYKFEEGVKKIEDYSFLGNCLLGSNVEPAYPCANAIDLSSLEQAQLMIATAFSEDKNGEQQLMEREEEKVNDTSTAEEKEEAQTVDAGTEETKETETVGTAESDTPDTADNGEVEQSEEQSVEPTSTELSAITDYDLRRSLSIAAREWARENAHEWAWVTYVMVDEGYCLCDFGFKAKELEYLKFDYEISEGEVRIVGEPEVVELVVAMTEINSTIASKDDAIAKANERIVELEDEVASLAPYKEEAERIAKEKEEAELAAKREEIKNYALKSKLISEEELAEGELASAIENVDYTFIKGLIADRFTESQTSVKSTKIETSTFGSSKEVRRAIEDGESAQSTVTKGELLVRAYIKK